MEAELTRIIEARGLTLDVVDPPDNPAGYPYIEVACAGRDVRFPMPWKPDPVPPNTQRLHYIVLITIQIYEECDDFLDWCAEIERNPAETAVLDDFRDLDGSIRTFVDMIGEADYDDLRLRMAIGEAISRASNFTRGEHE
jgi:hypothetical protein